MERNWFGKTFRFQWIQATPHNTLFNLQVSEKQLEFTEWMFLIIVLLIGGRDGRPNFTISMNPSTSVQSSTQGEWKTARIYRKSVLIIIHFIGEPDGRTTSSKPTENNRKRSIPILFLAQLRVWKGDNPKLQAKISFLPEGKPANMTEALSDLLNVVNRSYEVIHERMSSISDSIEQRQNQVASKDEVMSDKPIQKRRRSSSEKLP